MKPISEYSATDLLPIDTGEIDHVISILKQETDPEIRRHVLDGTMRSANVLERLQKGLHELICKHIEGWRQPLDKSDFANMSGDERIDPWMRAAAGAWCGLWWLQSCSDSIVNYGRDHEAPPLDQWDDWRRLRGNLIEVGNGLAIGQVIDESKRAESAERRARAMREALTKAAPVLNQMGDKQLLPKTQLYLDVRKADTNPAKRGRNIRAAKAIILAAPMNDDGKSPFFRRNHGALIDRATDQPITEDQMVLQIQQAITAENQRLLKVSKEGRRPSQK